MWIEKNRKKYRIYQNKWHKQYDAKSKKTRLHS